MIDVRINRLYLPPAPKVIRALPQDPIDLVEVVSADWRGR